MLPLKKESLSGGTVVYTGASWPITSDAMLLAEFCRPQRSFSVCDLGAGCGIILFSLLDKGVQGSTLAVELDENAAEAMRRSGEENAFSNFRVLNQDLRNIKTDTLFDMVVSNPPYFRQGAASSNPLRATARHQINCTLSDVCASAFRLLKDGGRFCVCFPGGDLAVLIATLTSHRLIPKRMQLVRSSHQKPARLVLMDARKNGGDHLDILPDIILNGENIIRY